MLAGTVVRSTMQWFERLMDIAGLIAGFTNVYVTKVRPHACAWLLGARGATCCTRTEALVVQQPTAAKAWVTCMARPAHGHLLRSKTDIPVYCLLQEYVMEKKNQAKEAAAKRE